MKRSEIKALAQEVLDSDLDFIAEEESEEAFISSVLISLAIQIVRELKK